MKKLFLTCATLLVTCLPLLAQNKFEPVVATVPALLAAYSHPSPTATATATVAGPTLVQQKTGTDTTHSVVVTLDAPAAAGANLVVCISHIATETITSVVGDGGETYTQIATKNGTGIAVDIWLSDAFGSGTSVVTVNHNPEIARCNAHVSEWTMPLTDAANTVTASGNSTSPATGTITPGNANNLLFACGGWVLDDYSSGPTNSFTRLTAAGSGAVWQEAAYFTQTSATAKSTGWTLSAGIQWAAAIAEFSY